MTAKPSSLPTITAVHGLVLHVPYPPAELSPNARVHYQRLARVKARYRAECAWAGKEALGRLYAACQRLDLPAPPIPLRLDFHPATARTRDDDNLVAAFKAGRDGLADALKVDDALFETTFRLHAADRRLANPLAPNPLSPAARRGWLTVTVGNTERTEP